MRVLGNSLCDTKLYADALSVYEAEFSTLPRVGGSEEAMLGVQGNLATLYHMLGDHVRALQLDRDAYFGYVKIHGEEEKDSLVAAFNYTVALHNLKQFEEAKLLLRKTMPVARRALGNSNEITFAMKKIYAEALYNDPAATLDDIREAVTMLEDMERIARRVFGGAHPTAAGIGITLREARAALRAREAPPSSSGGA